MEPQLPDLPLQQKMQLFYILQKAFVLGLLTGKGLMQQAQAAGQVEQVVNNAIQNLNEMMPGTDISSYLSDLMSGIKIPDGKE